MTYNVHACVGTDRRLDPGRIADVIASCEPDIVALQELDVGRARSCRVDQAEFVAKALGMEMHFHPAHKVHDELYGDAILTNGSSVLVKAAPLPTSPRHVGLEPRSALWVSAEVGGSRFDVINTHLGLRGSERSAQVDALIGPDWVGRAAPEDPLVLLGDFNAVPTSRAYRRIAARLRDAQDAAGGRPRPTFPSRLPLLRLDHVFVSHAVEVLRADTIQTPLARTASDHLPLLVECRELSRETAA